MKDILQENKTHPAPFPLERYQRIAILAAHPDDEVYGCGGLIAAAAQRKIHVKVFIATNGEVADTGQTHIVERRQEESRRAGELLGYDVEFLGLRDRSLRYDLSLVERITGVLLECKPDLVLAPTINDYHPDHQALALAALAAFPAVAPSADLGFYETVGPLDHATHYIDLTMLYECKRRAMQLFESQESILPYAQSIEARDRYRALPFAPKVAYAEVYRLVHGKTPQWCDELLATFNLQRVRDDAWLLPAEAPLISVLIRTIGDPFIFNTIASVVAQTYRPIEIVVVAARQLPEEMIRRINTLPEVRFIPSERDLSRSEAANIALHAARGRWLAFLDDDDYWMPPHLERLARELKASQELAVCTGAVVEDVDGNVLNEYCEPLQADLMLATNQIPIHTVLFDYNLVRRYQIYFDESLHILEDWDFWLQLQCFTKIKYVPGTSAVYRWADRSELFADRERLSDVRRKIHDKWFAKLGWERFERTIEALIRELDKRNNEVSVAKRNREFYEQQLALEREKLSLTLQKLKATDEQLTRVLNSKSWRLTRSLRAVARMVTKLLSG